MTDSVINTNKTSAPRRAQFEGMVYELKPKTLVIKDWLRSSNQLRSYNVVSQRLSNLLKTINPDTDQETAAKVKLWLEELFSVMNSDIQNFEKVVTDIESKAGKSPLYGTMQFSSEPTRLSYSHPIMVSIIKSLDSLNEISERIETVWMKGELADAHHNSANARLMKPVEITFEKIISATDPNGRKGGKYDPLEFIKQIKQYKSISDYLASHQTPSVVATGTKNKDISTDVKEIKTKESV